jgi:hypothetical protein
MASHRNGLETITVALRCSRQRASKGDGLAVPAGALILRGSLRSRLRMTVRYGCVLPVKIVYSR